jgi:cation diffusion facilitator family transporter
MRNPELPILGDLDHQHSHNAIDRPALLLRGLRLEYLSIGWNLVEGSVAIAAGLVAGSVALIGFGVDSFVEISSAAVIVWRIVSENRNDNDPSRINVIERRAQRLVGASLFIFGIYLLFESVSAIIFREQPDPSTTGIVLAVLSLSVMWWLARSIRRVGEELHSHAIEADSTQTLACWWMSLSLLIGLGLNAVFGWWWADPLAGIAISGLMLREAKQVWSGKDCCGL